MLLRGDEEDKDGNHESRHFFGQGPVLAWMKLDPAKEAAAAIRCSQVSHHVQAVAIGGSESVPSLTAARLSKDGREIDVTCSGCGLNVRTLSVRHSGVAESDDPTEHGFLQAHCCE